MSSNKLKTTSEDTLKGTGFNSMGWSESSRNVKNAKRMMSTFDDTVVKSTPAKKEKITVYCTKCNSQLKIVKGAKKLHIHNLFTYDTNINRYGYVRCLNETYTLKAPKNIFKEVKSVTINNQKIKTGDKIVYNAFKGSYGVVKQVQIRKIEQIQEVYSGKDLISYRFVFTLEDKEHKEVTKY